MVLDGEGRGSGIQSVQVEGRAARSGWAVGRCAPSSSTVEEILYGSVWNMITPLLTTDDVVKVRSAARRWNVGDRYGALGDTFLRLLKREQFEDSWAL